MFSSLNVRLANLSSPERALSRKSVCFAPRVFLYSCGPTSASLERFSCRLWYLDLLTCTTSMSSASHILRRRSQWPLSARFSSCPTQPSLALMQHSSSFELEVCSGSFSSIPFATAWVCPGCGDSWSQFGCHSGSWKTLHHRESGLSFTISSSSVAS